MGQDVLVVDDSGDSPAVSAVKLRDAASGLLDYARGATPSMESDVEDRPIRVRRSTRARRGAVDVRPLEVADDSNRSRRGRYLLLLAIVLGGIAFFIVSRRRARRNVPQHATMPIHEEPLYSPEDERLQPPITKS